MAGNLSADIAHAAAARERLTNLLAETAAQRKKKVRVLRAACDRNQQREQDVVDVAFILFVRGCPNYTVALEYASREFAKLNLPVLPDIQKQLEDRYLATSVEDLMQIANGASVLAVKWHKQELHFEQDLQIHRWIEKQNLEKGLAPSPRVVLRHLQTSQQTSAERSGHWRMISSSASSKWMQRFRQRWKMSLGTYPAGEKLTVETMRHKVLSPPPKTNDRQVPNWTQRFRTLETQWGLLTAQIRGPLHK